MTSVDVSAEFAKQYAETLNATIATLRAENARLRECVEAANAMARALLDKSSGAHECNGGPDRCWYCADNESDRAVVAAYDIARAALDAGEEKRDANG